MSRSRITKTIIENTIENLKNKTTQEQKKQLIEDVVNAGVVTDEALNIAQGNE